MTLANGCFSHPSCPSSSHCSLTDYSNTPLGSRKTRGLGEGSPIELLHFSHHYIVSLVLWANCLLPALEGSGSCRGMHPHFWNWDLLLAMSRNNFLFVKTTCRFSFKDHFTILRTGHMISNLTSFVFVCRERRGRSTELLTSRLATLL